MLKENKNMFKIASFVAFVSMYFSPYIFCEKADDFFGCKVSSIKSYTDLALDFSWNIFLAISPAILILFFIYFAYELLREKIVKIKAKKIIPLRVAKENFYLDVFIVLLFLSFSLGIWFGIIASFAAFFINYIFLLIFLDKDKKIEAPKKETKIIMLCKSLKIVSEKIVGGFFILFFFSFFYTFLSSFFDKSIAENIFLSKEIALVIISLLASIFYCGKTSLVLLAIFLSTLTNVTPAAVVSFIIISTLAKKENQEVLKMKKVPFLALNIFVGLFSGFILYFFDISLGFKEFDYDEDVFSCLTRQILASVPFLIFFYSKIQKIYLSIKKDLESGNN